MTRRHLAHWFAGCLLTLSAGAGAHAQLQDAYVEPLVDHDLQLFSPVDFDFNSLPIRDDGGFFFNYNRLSWANSGERTVIGKKGLVVPSEQIFVPGPFDEGDPDEVPQTYPIQNGIQEAPPDGDFGWGDRYELGYFRGPNGWLLGILDGPKITTSKIYGFQHLTIPNTLPLTSQFDDPNFPDSGTAITFPLGIALGAGTNDLTTTASGFGSVHVNFDTPEGFLRGWRDYHVNGPNNEQSPTTGGPSLVVLGQTVVNGQITAIILSRHADGIADNLDGDLTTFFVVFVDANGNGQFDDGEQIATGVDFDDLHIFNIRFDQMFVRNTTETTGVELMRTHELDNTYLPVKERRNRFSIGYGARFFRLRDDFYWEGRGDVLGRTYVGTNAENQLVGPQIRAKWTHQRGRFGFDLDGRFLAAYNIGDISQTSAVGEWLNPGGINSLINAQPTFSQYGRQENTFSPMAEMRVEASYQITSAFALKLGYTAMFVDNITRASQVVDYRLPDMGLLEGGHQDIFINGADFGIEAVY
jgi:hypothetical protein